MDEYPKQVALTDGETIVLRPLQRDDEQALIQFFAELEPGSAQFMKHDVRDPAVVRYFVENIDPDAVWAIVAVTNEGKIVGDATLHMNKRGWRRHIGEVRGVVAEPYRRRRLATALVHELVEQASVRKLRKLKAEILATQRDARKVFERMGFRVEARLSQHATDHEGNPHDVLILTNSVDELWNKMEELIAGMELAGGKF